MKRPAFQFYPSDWRTDVELQSCSITARGVWHEVICIMHECKPYGHLVLPGGQPMSDIQAARLVGCDLKTYRAALVELEAVRVFSRLKDGTIYSRRMVRDERLRTVRAESGRLGGNPNLVNHPDKQTPTKDQTKDQTKAPSESQPLLSSSSSSSSNGVQRTNEDAKAPDPVKPPGDISPKVNGNGKSKPPAGWHRTPEGIEKAGRLLGMQAKRGEDYDGYKRRIFDALNEQTA